jgi:hypothetical protein
MAFDVARQQAVFTGGNGSFTTWLLKGNAAQSAEFGFGCGPQISLLQPSGSSQPIIGLTSELEMRGAAFAFGFLAIGTSRQWMGGFPLPIALDGLGMPGCNIWQSLDIHSAFPSGSGVGDVASFSVPIPANIFFLGARLHLQAWAPDPAANTAGIVLTNGLTWTIGDF